MLPAVALKLVCDEVAEKWAPFMLLVNETIDSGRWKDLVLPAKLEREMFGKYLFKERIE